MTYERALPELDDLNRPFWTAGASGKLQLLRCRGCGHWLQPPSPVCPKCLGDRIEADTASGLAVVESFTINRQPWIPGIPVPCVIALVALPEQPGLRMMTNLVGIEPEGVRIGMEVRVVFERDADTWIPLFEPANDLQGKTKP